MAEKKEIEIKVEISESDFNSVLVYLSDTCNVIENTMQHDIYFSPPDDNYMEEKYPFKWLSLRMRGEKIRLCFKHFFPEGSEKHDYCNEYEVELDDINAMRKILSELKFIIVADVKKNRKTFIYDNKFYISLDMVDMLGYFMEIELIATDGNYAIERENMLEIIKKLGIYEYRLDLRGYPFLMYEKNKEKN